MMSGRTQAHRGKLRGNVRFREFDAALLKEEFQHGVLVELIKQDFELFVGARRILQIVGRRLGAGGIVHKRDAEAHPGADLVATRRGGMLSKLDCGLTAGDEVLQIELVVTQDDENPTVG